MKFKNWTGERLETFVQNETSVEHLHRYSLALSLIQYKIVLDIACGEGYGANLMAVKAKKVVGVDIAADVISRAQKKYVKNNLSFIQGSAAKIPLDDKLFDVVISFETIEHHDRHDDMISEIKRVLKPGGILIISSPDKLYYTEKRNFHNPYHVKELYKDEFKLLIDKNFKNTSYYLQKAVFASFIVPEKEVSSFTEYKGNYQQIKSENDFEQMYIIAIASDSALPNINFTVFTDDDLMSKLHESTVEKVHSTLSYKLGHTLLWPVILAKKMFSRN